jgi:hypothetical protein
LGLGYGLSSSRTGLLGLLLLLGLFGLQEYPLNYGPFQLAALGCLLALLPRSSDSGSG